LDELLEPQILLPLLDPMPWFEDDLVGSM
jgi:hypothetical protein